MADVTSTKWRVYQALCNEIDRYGHSPTIRELADMVKLAPSTVHRYLKLLKQESWINWPSGKARSIDIRQDAPVASGVRRRRLTPAPTSRFAPQDDRQPKTSRPPVHLSELEPDWAPAAGPAVAVQLVEDALAKSGIQFGDGDLFTHRVRGESMRDGGIHDGDTLLVRRQPNAREGDIVVATVPDEATGEPLATVKRLPRSGRIRLLPENRAYQPIDDEGIVIVGKVLGLWRAPV